MLLVGNKKDILPKSVKDGKVTQWLMERAHEVGLRPVDVVLTSAQNKLTIKNLMEKIESHRKGRDVYVVGVTNVGKSTLINAIIQEITGDKDIITTSRFPGTTLDKIEIPLDDGSYLFDTPGIIHRHQMAHYLTAKNLKYISPKKEIKPKTYQLNAQQTLFLGGLARFDFVSGDKQGFTAYFDNNLTLHRTKLEGADAFYDIPGTTLDKIEIPLDDGSYLFDTPGIIHRHQMAHYLTAKNLNYISPKKEIKHKTYQLNPEQTLFLAGLGRFDFIEGERKGFTAFFENTLELHRTKLAGANTFYQKHVGSLLVPPSSKEKRDFPELIRHEFMIKEKTDVVFSGLGWIRVNEKAKIAAWAPKGVDVVLRKAII